MRWTNRRRRLTPPDNVIGDRPALGIRILAAARATLALKAAPKTRRFPLIVMLRKGCLPPSELHLISAPENRGPPHVVGGVVVYSLDGKVHAFSAALGKWDSVPASVDPLVSDDVVIIDEPDSIAVFSAATGRWAVARTSK